MTKTYQLSKSDLFSYTYRLDYALTENENGKLFCVCVDWQLLDEHIPYLKAAFDKLYCGKDLKGLTPFSVKAISSAIAVDYVRGADGPVIDEVFISVIDVNSVFIQIELFDFSDIIEIKVSNLRNAKELEAEWDTEDDPAE